MPRITTTELAERVSKLEDLVRQQDRVIAQLAAKTATQGQVRAAFAAVRDVERVSTRAAAMERARAEAIRTGKPVKVVF
jgi:hypothetical protein